MSNPLFEADGPDLVFKRFLARGEFRIQRCDACTHHIFYPRLICPHCGTHALSWVAASGNATVYSTSVPRQPPEQGGDYNISLVDLAEGPRMMTRVVDIAPQDVIIGMAVQAFIGDIDGMPLVLFRPRRGA